MERCTHRVTGSQSSQIVRESHAQEQVGYHTPTSAFLDAGVVAALSLFMTCTSAHRTTALLTLAVALVISSACGGSTSVPSGTYISPEFFEYQTIIEPPEDGSPGGWRAVCIRARLGQTMASPQGVLGHSHIECGLEFGSPIVTRDLGYIPLHVAQRTSADVANEVAYEVLQEVRGMTTVICRALHTGMTKGMNEKIKGSTVTACGVTRSKRPVPEVTWPPLH